MLQQSLNIIVEGHQGKRLRLYGLGHVGTNTVDECVNTLTRDDGDAAGCGTVFDAIWSDR